MRWLWIICRMERWAKFCHIYEFGVPALESSNEFFSWFQSFKVKTIAPPIRRNSNKMLRNNNNVTTCDQVDSIIVHDTAWRVFHDIWFQINLRRLVRRVTSIYVNIQMVIVVEYKPHNPSGYRILVGGTLWICIASENPHIEFSPPLKRVHTIRRHFRTSTKMLLRSSMHAHSHTLSAVQHTLFGKMHAKDAVQHANDTRFGTIANHE